MSSVTKLNRSEILNVFLKYKEELLEPKEHLKLKSCNQEVFFKIQNELSNKMSRKYIYLSIKRMSLKIFGEVIQTKDVEQCSDEYKPPNEPAKFDILFSTILENDDLSPIQTQFRGRVRQTPPANWTEKLIKLLWDASNQSIVCCFNFKSGSYLYGEFITEGKNVYIKVLYTDRRLQPDVSLLQIFITKKDAFFLYNHKSQLQHFKREVTYLSAICVLNIILPIIIILVQDKARKVCSMLLLFLNYLCYEPVMNLF